VLRGERKIKRRGNVMNQNLNLLRQNHCRGFAGSNK
jgi:hypothetical protein